jgi:hypothetical protein
MRPAICRKRYKGKPARYQPIESEFLAHVVLPGNRTVIDELEPVIASAYRSGQRPSISNAATPRAD